MNEDKFKVFLKRGGRTDEVAQKAVMLTRQFEEFLNTESASKKLDEASAQDLLYFVDWIERSPNISAKVHLWALCYYYEFVHNDKMRHLVGALRQARIDRTPFPLKDFSGVDASTLERLATLGIKNTKQMLEAGQTPQRRQSLSEKTGVPPEMILKLVKLSDLARIPGVKDIRARLYYEAGVDTVEKLAFWEPEALRAMIVAFVAKTGFDGVPTLPKEAGFTVLSARKLPKFVQY